MTKKNFLNHFVYDDAIIAFDAAVVLTRFTTCVFERKPIAYKKKGLTRYIAIIKEPRIS